MLDLFEPPKPVSIPGPTRTHQLDVPVPSRTPDEVRLDARARMAIKRERKRQERIAAGTYISRADAARMATQASAEARRLPPEVAKARKNRRIQKAKAAWRERRRASKQAQEAQ